MPHGLPPIIILMADQLRGDALGRHTPNLRALARDSCSFDRCYCASPLCVPARGSFFTGRYPNETGSIINPWEPLDSAAGFVKAGMPNLYTLLEGEWDSWHAGKQHLYTEEGMHTQPGSRTRWITLEKDYRDFLKAHGRRSPGGPRFKAIMPEVAQNRFTRLATYSIPTTGRYDEGFDYFYDGYIASASLRAIREHSSERPLLLNSMFVAPHPPLEIPDPWFSLLRPDDVVLPANVGRWAADQSPLQLWNLPGLLGTRYAREQWREVWRVYLGLTALLDHCVGLIVGELKARGIYDESIIVFTSDHGEMLGSHMLWQKMCCYEEAVHVPLFIKLPKGRTTGQVRRTGQLVSHVDILPTILDLIGSPPPETLSGVSLLPAMQGGRIDREGIFVQYDGNGTLSNFSRTIVSGCHKLNVDRFKDEVFFELYDLDRDPGEAVNLAFEDTERVRTMLGSLIAHMERTKDHLELSFADYDTFLRGYTPFRKAVREKVDGMSPS